MVLIVTDTDNRKMQEYSGSIFIRRCSAVLLLIFPVMANINPVSAGESNQAASGWAGTYAGLFAGFGKTDNRIVDVEGFANWGNPGYRVDYDDSGFVGGPMLGKRFDINGLPLRIELDATFGSLSATSNRLDPVGLDETVKSEIDWVATARAGIEQAIGSATVFITGGLALARIDNSVTDIDFGPNRPTQVDPDDSFSAAATEIGWVSSVGVEAPFAADWRLRLEGSYLDFGRSTHYVNRSGDGRCGPGMPRRPCPYNVKNKLSIVRLTIIRQF